MASEQMMREEPKCQEEEQQKAMPEQVRLPMESSPYLKYTDLEDYKRQAYGTEGHLEPKTGRGAGGTDAPTQAGTAPSNV